MEATSSRRKHFTQEKKESIINEYHSTGISLQELARKYGVHAMSLYYWKRQMKDKKDESPISPDFIRKIIEENDQLKKENKNLKAKIGDLAITNDILKDGMEIVQKKAALMALLPPKKSKRLIGMK